MDKVVQQNAANSEESASGAEEMNAQAEKLKRIVEDLGAMIEGSRRLKKTKTDSTAEYIGETAIPQEHNPRRSPMDFLKSTSGKKPEFIRSAEVASEPESPARDDDFTDF